MAFPFSDKVLNILVCCHCGSALDRIEQGVRCPACNVVYSRTDSGSLDLRLKQPKKYHLEFDVTTPLSNENVDSSFLAMNASPEVDFSQTGIPYHLTKELASYFPKARSPHSLMLDLGCGDGVHKKISEYAGFEWVGLDYNIPDAPILGDAHSLPFCDESFDFILSVAVLEHIRFPFVMMREAYRVLKPGGRFIGTVSFLEPFHDQSLYHHSHLGTLNSLQFGGFTVIKLAPSRDWSVLAAQADMSLFPGMPLFLARSLIFPVQMFHRMWWQFIGLIKHHDYEPIRARNTTASFSFVAFKEPSRSNRKGLEK